MCARGVRGEKESGLIVRAAHGMPAESTDSAEVVDNVVHVEEEDVEGEEGEEGGVDVLVEV